MFAAADAGTVFATLRSDVAAIDRDLAGIAVLSAADARAHAAAVGRNLSA